MLNKTDQNSNSPNKKSAFEYFTEVVGWLQIMVSPLLIGIMLGGIIYILNPKKITLILAIVLAFLGLVIGIIWATKVWKKKGTISFMSSIMSTGESDPKDQESN